ncbi:RNA-guided endonuclease InsQ/TnpB family protein [Piscinibacter sp.]|uniref:RNA-guided endonuclease InsQ/TnpB family protein n=1 Tax=Piscinibacter sp. TaxID=1903157 RepID=UPI00355A108F
MLVRQGFQYALRLKAQREAVLRRWVGCRRFVFNEGLAHQRAEIAAGRKRPGYSALCARLPALKAQHPWLCEPPAQALQQALKDLCKAWDARFNSRFGAPRFKKKGEGDTLRLPQDCRYDMAAGLVHLPKLGSVRLRHSREALGTLKNVTLRQEGRRWVASLQTEREVDAASPVAAGAVGLDFGAATTIMPSVGSPIELPPRIGRYERRMKRLQQSVSRKKKGSANRRKAVARLNECHRHIAAMRRDFLHQKTTDLVASHALIVIEDLAVKNMTASAAGTADAPGRRVRQKAGLNRTILRNGWSKARQRLEYKAAWRGAMLVAVPPAYTSQECSACRHTAAENRKTQAVFECVACGHRENADRNAAKNILRRGQEQLAQVGCASEIQSGGCPASTAGYAGTHACEGAQRKLQHPRPRSAAQGRSEGLPLAGTVSELSLSGNLHP